MYDFALTRSYVPAQNEDVVLDSTVGGVLQTAAALHGDLPFLTELAADGRVSRHWSYVDMQRDADRCAALLRGYFQPGEHVLVCAPNTPEWVILQFGAALAGVVLVTANPDYRHNELQYVLEHSGAVGLFVCPDHRGNPLAETAVEIARDRPQIRHIFDITKLMDLTGPDMSDRPARPTQASDAAQIQYTSGTTGRPKGALISHRALTNNARMTLARQRPATGDRMLHFMPLFHTGGCGFLLLGALQHGLHLFMLGRFDARIVNDVVEREGITMLLGVPTMLIGMLEAWAQCPRDMSSLRLTMMGGSPVSPELVRQVRQTFQCDVAVLYGQTEASSNISSTWLADDVHDLINSVGQPLPHTEVSIQHPSDGTILDIGQIGEICVRSYTCLIGYHGDPQASAKTLDDDGWMHTGDLGRLDARGYLTITGRLKDMIVRGGENIYPVEIENLLAQHPSVAEAAVIGVPDDKWGETVACFIRPAPGEALNIEALTAYCRQNLARAKIPVYWHEVDQWPLTGSGKIQKSKLTAT